MSIREQIEDFIVKLTNEPVQDHTMNLFASGRLFSSLDFLDLLAFIEETFNISIPDDDVSIETLGSIDSIVNLIEKFKKES